jgi:hypothetical protein
VSELRTAAREAFVYTLPLIEVATTRQRGMALGQQMGAFSHVRTLANHKHRAVTTPNCDTLYSTAHLDLSAGPVTITLPAAGERYLSLALWTPTPTTSPSWGRAPPVRMAGRSGWQGRVRRPRGRA